MHTVTEILALGEADDAGRHLASATRKKTKKICPTYDPIEVVLGRKKSAPTAQHAAERARRERRDETALAGVWSAYAGSSIQRRAKLGLRRDNVGQQHRATVAVWRAKREREGCEASFKRPSPQQLISSIFQSDHRRQWRRAEAVPSFAALARHCRSRRRRSGQMGWDRSWLPSFVSDMGRREEHAAVGPFRDALSPQAPPLPCCFVGPTIK